MKFPKLKSKAIMAPMAGVTEIAFRALVRKYGAGLTYTELISSAGIVRNNIRTKTLLRKADEENPSAVQLFGGNINELLKATTIVEKDFDIIDINCGCPATKVTKIGAGCSLIKEPIKIEKLVNILTQAIKKPITLKIRTGEDEKHINALQIAKLAEKVGASAITIHGRTIKQGYKGKANWDLIKQVKENVNIPIIGNGDITSPEIFKERLETSGVDYIMIGRAAMSNPFIFKQIEDYLRNNTYETKKPYEIFEDYYKFAEKYEVPFSIAKVHAVHFTKGFYRSSKIRQDILLCKKPEEILKLLSLL